MTEDKRLKEIRALYKDESFVFDFDEGVTHEFVGELLSEIDRLKEENRVAEIDIKKWMVWLDDAESKISSLEAKLKELEYLLTKESTAFSEERNRAIKMEARNKELKIGIEVLKKTKALLVEALEAKSE